MKLVLDTDIMVAAIRSDSGASRRLLEAALGRQFVLLASTSLMFEYEAVMTRPEHLAASGLNEADVGRLLDAVAAVVLPVRLSFSWRPQLRDPDDDMVLEAAVNGGADAIATFNEKHFLVGSKLFALQVLRPGAALRRLEI